MKITLKIIFLGLCSLGATLTWIYFGFSPTWGFLLFALIFVLSTIVVVRQAQEKWREAYGLASIYIRGLLKNQPQPALPKFGNQDTQEFLSLLSQLGDETRARTQAMSELEKLRVEFVANVSHELQTPLTSIKGYTETLKQGAWQDPQVAEKFLRRIGENADRLKALISDILTLSYIETFPKDVEWETFSSLKMKEKLESMFEPLIKEKRQVLKVEFNSTTLEGDFSKLLQVFTNLVDNAVKYSPDGTQILVTENFYDNKYHFLVEDTGKGIPSVHLPRLFERFYRVDAARSRETGGTGLGLSIVKHIVAIHGGDIQVGSKVGLGTKFSFQIPSRRPATFLS